MNAYARPVSTVSQEVSVACTDHGVPKTDTLVNCYTIEYDEKTKAYCSDPVEGILVDCSIGKTGAVVLGYDDCARSVFLDRFNPPPMLRLGGSPFGGMFSASVQFREHNGRERYYLVPDDFEADRVLLKIHTGDPHFVSMKRRVDHGVKPIKGHPRLIGRSAHTSRTDEVVSRVYLCELEHDEELHITTVTGEHYKVGFQRGQKPWIEKMPAEEANALSVREDFDETLRRAREGVEVRNREGARHHLVDIAVETGNRDFWIEILSLLEERQAHDKGLGDISLGLLRRISETCTVLEIRDWATTALERKPGFEHADAMTMCESSSASNHSAKKRQVKEAKRAARRASDIAQNDERRSRLRPGTQDGTSRDKKRSGKAK